MVSVDFFALIYLMYCFSGGQKLSRVKDTNSNLTATNPSNTTSTSRQKSPSPMSSSQGHSNRRSSSPWETSKPVVTVTEPDTSSPSPPTGNLGLDDFIYNQVLFTHLFAYEARSDCTEFKLSALLQHSGFLFTIHSLECSFSPRFYKFECNTTYDWLNRKV